MALNVNLTSSRQIQSIHLYFKELGRCVCMLWLLTKAEKEKKQTTKGTVKHDESAPRGLTASDRRSE